MKTKILTALFFSILIHPAFAATRPNLALNQPITTGTSAGLNNSAQKADDGSRDTFWQGKVLPDWAKISFPSVKLISQFIIRMPIENTSHFVNQEMSIEYTSDGVNWKPLRAKGIVSFHYCDGSKPNGAPATWTGACSLSVSLESAVEMKQFRVNVFRRWKNDVLQPGGQIAEIELYN